MLKAYQCDYMSAVFFDFVFYNRKFAGCVMDQVTAMEMIDATTAVEEGGKSMHFSSNEIETIMILKTKLTTACSVYRPMYLKFFFSCIHCHGQGSKQCEICHGKQQLLVYINLTVKWYSFVGNVFLSKL